MQTLNQAFKEWTKTFPGTITGSRIHVHTLTGVNYKIPPNSDGRCGCKEGHSQQIRVLDKAGIQTGSYRTVPLPDNKVCERERAWRAYISIRDNKNYHVGVEA